MKTFITGVAGVGLLLLTGCETKRTEEVRSTATMSAALGADQGLPPPGGSNAACPGTRWVGARPELLAACPAPVDPAWTGGLLFGAPDTPAPLDRYCAYEWHGEGGAPPTNRPLLAGAVNDWLEADCHVVGAQSASRDVVWSQLLDAHHQQIGVVRPLPGGPDAATVRIAVADSAIHGFASGAPSYGDFDHGRAVGLAARHLACPPEGGPCLGLVSSHLALPRDPGGALDPTGGGYYGYQSEVAQAIFHAVRDWQRQTPGPGEPPQERLVINLSLGWSSAYGGPYPAGSWQALRPPVRAVHEAVAWARCNGALVLAAAGNAAFGPLPEQGPLFPAGWEHDPAPTPLQCQSMGDVVVTQGRPAFPSTPPGGEPAYDALLFAVAGLDHLDRPLYNTRPASLTRVAVPALHVVARDPDPEGDGFGPPQPTAAYTGSSMAAATLSGIAASLWAHAPDLAPAEVMGYLHRSGVVLGGLNAHVCHGGPCGPVRRVSQCLALRSLCLDRPGACTVVPSCDDDVVPAFAGTNAVADPATDADGDGTPDLDEALGTAPVDGSALLTLTATGCAGRPMTYAPDPSGGTAPPAIPCPNEALPDTAIAPWAGPQPDVDLCDVCLLFATAMYLGITDDIPASTQLVEPTLTRFDKSGNVIDSIRLDYLNTSMVPLGAGDFYKILGLPAASATVESATVSFIVQGTTTSKTSAVMIY